MSFSPSPCPDASPDASPGPDANPPPVAEAVVVVADSTPEGWRGGADWRPPAVPSCELAWTLVLTPLPPPPLALAPVVPVAVVAISSPLDR